MKNITFFQAALMFLAVLATYSVVMQLGGMNPFPCGETFLRTIGALFRGLFSGVLLFLAAGLIGSVVEKNTPEQWNAMFFLLMTLRVIALIAVLLASYFVFTI